MLEELCDQVDLITDRAVWSMARSTWMLEELCDQVGLITDRAVWSGGWVNADAGAAV
jgi:hypothetical protein